MEAVATLSTSEGRVLRTWGGSAIPGELEQERCEGDTSFRCSTSLNRKLVLWKGAISTLKVDAIVLRSNESLNPSGVVQRQAGPGLLAEIKRTELCSTGDVVITDGHLLPARWIIHSVGPRWSERYETAAEGALHSCYRRCFEVALERNIDSIAFSVLNDVDKGYPAVDGAHVAFRTIRRCLEKWGDSIHQLVLVVTNQRECDVYNRILPLYFPRSREEEEIAKRKLPDFKDNEFGERVHSHRRIRIHGGPGSTIAERGPHRLFAGAPPKSFSLCREGPDERRDPQKQRKASSRRREEKHARRQKQYEQRVARARQSDFSDFDRLNFIQCVGTDLSGRAVVVVSACRVPAKTASNERIMLYIIRTLDAVVSSNFVVVYFHAGCQSVNQPDLSFFRRLHKALPRQYKKNLKSLFIVHPSLFVKMVTMFTRPFVKRKFKRKIRNISSLSKLFEIFQPDLLQVPEEVLAFDRLRNKSDYEDWASKI